LVANLLDDQTKSAVVELQPYLVDSFGNATRIDYGSGHEAAFMTFIMCLYKLGHLKHPDNDKAVVLRVFHRYLKLVRKLQTDYRMEPAGKIFSIRLNMIFYRFERSACIGRFSVLPLHFWKLSID
jgi:serine/threonine-protein phosphatase 2A activator